MKLSKTQEKVLSSLKNGWVAHFRPFDKEYMTTIEKGAKSFRVRQVTITALERMKILKREKIEDKLYTFKII